MTPSDPAPPPAPADVPGALAELGVVVTRLTDTEAWARCPGHAAMTGRFDRSPSWSANLTSGIHLCFSCGYRGCFADLVELLLGVDAFAARMWVRRRAGISRATMLLNDVAVQTPPVPAAVTDDDLSVYGYPPAWALAQRHTTIEAASYFGVLWAPPATWILPIRRLDGTLMGWQTKTAAGEKLTLNHPAGVRKADTLFGASCWSATPLEQIVLVESPLDALVLRTAGHPAVAAFGAHVSQRQIQMLRALCPRVVAMLDNDHAGRAGTHALLRDGHGLLRITLADYTSPAKDPGEMDAADIGSAIARARSPLGLTLPPKGEMFTSSAPTGV